MSEPKDHTQRPLHALAVDLSLFTSGQIRELISQVKDVSIGVGSYREIFSREAKARELNGEKIFADTLQVLFLISDMSLRSGDIKKPFQPSSWVGNSRSPIPDDFTDEQIAQLDLAIAHLSDPRIVARLSDVVWVKLKRVASARGAIDAYLQAAKDDRMMEMERFWCLERAFRLAKQISSKKQWTECEKVFGEFRENPALYERLSIDLLSLAQTFTIIEPKTLAEEARRLAQAVGGQDPHQAKELALIASTVFTKLGDKNAAADCHRKTAEVFLAIAKQMDALNSISFIEEAIEALRRAGAPKAEIQELNKMLTTKGQESAAQMKRIEGPRIDFTDTVQAARKLIEGVPPIEALAKLAFQFPILGHDEYKAQVEQSIKDHPLMYLIEAKHITRDGRQYTRRASFMSDDPKERKESLDTEIATAMAPQIEAVTRFCLIPALREVHCASRDLVALFNIISHRPIVPPGRAEFFLSGIQAGLEGDFLEAAHILIPQLENALRFILEARGLVVTSLDSENLHSEMSLNRIFGQYRKEIVALLGSEDLVYMMESFLCSKAGENFRNELSHGLVSNPHDYRFAVTWWLALHLLFRLKFPDAEEEINR